MMTHTQGMGGMPVITSELFFRKLLRSRRGASFGGSKLVKEYASTSHFFFEFSYIFFAASEETRTYSDYWSCSAPAAWIWGFAFRHTPFYVLRLQLPEETRTVDAMKPTISLLLHLPTKSACTLFCAVKNYITLLNIISQQTPAYI
jgi:hypothetical protein